MVNLSVMLWLHLSFQRIQSIGELFDVATFCQLAACICPTSTYPLLGPRFMGSRLKAHDKLERLQLVQVSCSVKASQRIFLRRHSSHARLTLTRLSLLLLLSLACWLSGGLGWCSVKGPAFTGCSDGDGGGCVDCRNCGGVG